MRVARPPPLRSPFPLFLPPTPPLLPPHRITASEPQELRMRSLLPSRNPMGVFMPLLRGQKGTPTRSSSTSTPPHAAKKHHPLAPETPSETLLWSDALPVAEKWPQV